MISVSMNTGVKKLDALCIDIIIRNFDRFWGIFKCRHAHLLSYMKFIQKKYCYDLQGKLSDCNIMKNEHVQFLINEYTPHLDMRLFQKCDYNVINVRLQEVGSVILKFSMANLNNPYDIGNLLWNLSSVEVLELRNTNCTDKTMKIIAEKCHSLKSLDVRKCEKVTDIGIKCLCRGKLALKQLNINDTAVTYKGVAHLLRNMPSVIELWHRYVPEAVFEAVGLNDILGDNVNLNLQFNLINIIIMNNTMRPEIHFIEIMKACAKYCPHIKELFVTDIVTNEQLVLCSAFRNVETVSLSCFNSSSPNLCINSYLKELGNNLHTIRLGSFIMSIEVLSQCCPNLKNVTLGYLSFEKSHVRREEISFPHLKLLTFEKINFETAENAAAASIIISASPNLEDFRALNCLSPNAIIDAILKFPQKLTSLNLSSTIINIETVHIILAHIKIKRLVIENSGITEAEYDDLVDMLEEKGSDVHIIWADHSATIRALFGFHCYGPVFHDYSRQILLT